MKKPAASRSKTPFRPQLEVDPLREAARLAYDKAKAAHEAAAKASAKELPQ